MEKVNTGGTISFQYSKNSQPKLSKEESWEIDKAYMMADERKRISKEKRKKRNLLISIIIFLILVAIFIKIKYF